MRIEAELCHIEGPQCVVRVSGWNGEIALGSAMGQGETAEQAEDRALERLCSRLINSSSNVRAEMAPTKSEGATSASGSKKHGLQKPRRTQPQSETDQSAEPTKPNTSHPGQDQNQAGMEDLVKEKAERLQLSRHPGPEVSLNETAAPKKAVSAVAAKAFARELPRETPSKSSRDTPSEAPIDPDDWSDELAAIDLQLQRIGWDRDQEKVYLNRAFGHGSRHRFTIYADLVAYLKRLEGLQPGLLAEQAPVPMRRSDLLNQSDQLLQQLNWTSDQGKQLLKETLEAESRQHLSDEQLLNFNMMLEEEFIKVQNKASST